MHSEHAADRLTPRQDHSRCDTDEPGNAGHDIGTLGQDLRSMAAASQAGPG